MSTNYTVTKEGIISTHNIEYYISFESNNKDLILFLDNELEGLLKEYELRIL